MNTCKKCHTWKESSKGKKNYLHADRSGFHIPSADEKWDKGDNFLRDGCVLILFPRKGRCDTWYFLPSPCTSYMLGVVRRVSTWAELKPWNPAVPSNKHLCLYIVTHQSTTVMNLRSSRTSIFSSESELWLFPNQPDQQHSVVQTRPLLPNHDFVKVSPLT